MVENDNNAKHQKPSWLNCKPEPIINMINGNQSLIWYIKDKKCSAVYETASVDALKLWLKLGHLVHGRGHEVGIFLRDNTVHYTVPKKLLIRGNHYKLSPQLINKLTEGNYRLLTDTFQVMGLLDIFTVKRFKDLTINSDALNSLLDTMDAINDSIKQPYSYERV